MLFSRRLLRSILDKICCGDRDCRQSPLRIDNRIKVNSNCDKGTPPVPPGTETVR